MKDYEYGPAYHRVQVRQFKIMTETTGEIALSMLTPEEEAILQAGHTFGELVAMGHTAFYKDRWGEPCERVYKLGDSVYFKQYPGPVHNSETDDYGRPQGDTLFTINDVDVLGHVKIKERKHE